MPARIKAQIVPAFSINSGRLFLQSFAHLGILRELAGGFFGIDLFAVGEHLEATVVIGDESELANALLVVSE